MKNIIPRLEAIKQENSNMGLLANYLLEYDGDLAELKISKICDELYISVASATRLAKRLGLDGFSQLKIYLVEERTQNKVSTQKYSNISSQKYLSDIVDSLSATLDTVDLEKIEQVSKCILEANKVNFFAVGGSNIVTADFAQKLSRIRIPITNYGDTHFQYVEAINSTTEHLAIGLSYSGLTHEILSNLQLSKQHGAKTVLITNNKNIKYDFIDYVIDVNSTDNSMRTYSISSRFSSLAIFDLLYLTIIDSDIDYYNDLLNGNRYIK